MDTFRIAIMFVGATLILAVVGIVYLAIDPNRAIPDILQNIASGALAGLIGLLVNPARNAGV